MIGVYIIIGAVIFSFFEKRLIKMSPKYGWRIFLTVYILISLLCVYAFAGFANKFSFWQKIILLLIFTLSSILRLLYYRGSILPDKKRLDK